MQIVRFSQNRAITGQPALGAAVAAVSGDDPVTAAAGSEVAAGLGAVESAASLSSDAPKSTTRAGLVRGAVATARQIGTNAVKTIAKSEAGNITAEEIVDRERE